MPTSLLLLLLQNISSSLSSVQHCPSLSFPLAPAVNATVAAVSQHFFLPMSLMVCPKLLSFHFFLKALLPCLTLFQNLPPARIRGTGHRRHQEQRQLSYLLSISFSFSSVDDTLQIFIHIIRTHCARGHWLSVCVIALVFLTNCILHSRIGSGRHESECIKYIC